jgi:hypothetical protein
MSLSSRYLEASCGRDTERTRSGEPADEILTLSESPPSDESKGKDPHKLWWPRCDSNLRRSADVTPSAREVGNPQPKS